MFLETYTAGAIAVPAAVGNNLKDPSFIVILTMIV
jgi:hypothetical protein